MSWTEPRLVISTKPAKPSEITESGSEKAAAKLLKKFSKSEVFGRFAHYDSCELDEGAMDGKTHFIFHDKESWLSFLALIKEDNDLDKFYTMDPDTGKIVDYEYVSEINFNKHVAGKLIILVNNHE